MDHLVGVHMTQAVWTSRDVGFHLPEGIHSYGNLARGHRKKDIEGKRHGCQATLGPEPSVRTQYVYCLCIVVLKSGGGF